MRSLVAPLERMIRRLGQSPVIAGIVLTVVTIVLIGGVVLTMTAAGCGPAKALGIKGITNRCAESLTARSSPGASPTASASASPSYAVSPPPSTEPVVTPTAAPVPPTIDPSSPGGTPSYPTVADASGSGGSVPGSLNCRLPVFLGMQGSGGFLLFPGSTFIPDPGSSVTYPSPSPGGPTPAPGYPQNGQSGLTYDRAYSKWLPVPMQQVSADGKLYAFAAADGIYVVTVSSGAVTELGQGRSWTILSVGTAGVYATVPSANGLWLLPLSGAAPQQLTASGYWQGVGGGAAYGTATSAVPQGAANTIQQLDLTTNAIKNYFTRAGMQSRVAGFDAHGSPVIYASGATGSEIWIGGMFLSAYVGGPYGTVGFVPSGPPVADSYGVWFAGTYYSGGAWPTIVLYIPGSGMYGMSPSGGQLAGGCY